MGAARQGRPDWEAYFLAMALIASSRSTCLRRKVGAVVVSANRIVATGYNGSPANTQHCTDIGCLRQRMGVPSGERHEICRGAHAEMNAIAQAAAHGVPIDGCTLFCTHEPCSMCSKLLIQAGCRRIVFLHAYPDDLSRSLRKEAGIESAVYEAEDVADRVLAAIPGDL